MATTLSLCFSIDPQHHHYKNHCRRQSPPAIFTPFTQNPKQPLLISRKFDRYRLVPSFSSPQSPPSTTTTTTTTTTTASYYIQDSVRPGRFLTNEELEKLQILENFRYYQELETGSVWIRVMKSEEMDSNVGLLSESFAESMLLPTGYVSLLMFLVKQYLIERRGLVPHTATLIGFYKGNEEDSEGEGQLAGTVEVSFDKRGANASPPTPRPPTNSPYVCNMTVKKPLRRRGIGWHLLKASEELISQMTSSREVYLHCRMIDEAPFNMYRKAGYNVVKTDSIFILLTLQRRKHLMCKRLLVLKSTSEMDISGPDEEQSS